MKKYLLLLLAVMAIGAQAAKHATGDMKSMMVADTTAIELVSE